MSDGAPWSRDPDLNPVVQNREAHEALRMVNKENELLKRKLQMLTKLNEVIVDSRLATSKILQFGKISDAIAEAEMSERLDEVQKEIDLLKDC